MAVTLDEQTGAVKEAKGKVSALSLHALFARVMSLPCAQEGKKYLEFHGWLAAFDTFALLVAVLEQMTFAEAMQYKAIVLKVGCTAGA